MSQGYFVVGTKYFRTYLETLKNLSKVAINLHKSKFSRNLVFTLYDKKKNFVEITPFKVT